MSQASSPRVGISCKSRGESRTSQSGVGICCTNKYSINDGEMSQTNQQCEGVECTNRPAIDDGEMNQTSGSGVGIRRGDEQAMNGGDTFVQCGLQ